MQVWVHVCPGPLTWHQFVLKSCDSPAYICLRDGLHKECALCQAETVHCALSLVLLCQQQRQVAGTLQIHMRTLNREDVSFIWFYTPHCNNDILIVEPANKHNSYSLMLISQYWWPYLGVSERLDAHMETCHVSRWGLCVRPQVDDDGSCRVEPLQRPLRAA